VVFTKTNIKTLTENNIPTDRFETYVCCKHLDIMVDFKALTLWGLLQALSSSKHELGMTPGNIALKTNHKMEACADGRM
jgi:hypothetical protein